MLVVRATKNLLDRLGPVSDDSLGPSTTRLGDWYAKPWNGRPQIALFISEAILFPVLMPLAPSATLLQRFPGHLASALTAQDVPGGFIAEELERMREVRLGRTANRSVLGVLNEFTFLAQETTGRPAADDLPELTRWLARTPCSPIYRRHVSPDRELKALVAAHQQ